jgi:hypothetical protein
MTGGGHPGYDGGGAILNDNGNRSSGLSPRQLEEVIPFLYWTLLCLLFSLGVFQIVFILWQFSWHITFAIVAGCACFVIGCAGYVKLCIRCRAKRRQLDESTVLLA